MVQDKDKTSDFELEDLGSSPSRVEVLAILT